MYRCGGRNGLAMGACNKGERPRCDAINFLLKEMSYKPSAYNGVWETDDYQWVRPAKDYASTRCSTLNEINQSKVKSLKLAFTFSTGLGHGHEAAPLAMRFERTFRSTAKCCQSNALNPRSNRPNTWRIR